jgi:uncharacterized protein
MARQPEHPRTGSGSPPAANRLPWSLPLNVPAVAGVAVSLIGGQLVLFSFFPPIAARERIHILVSILTYSALLTCVAALAGGTVARVTSRSCSAMVWMLLAGAATLYFADGFSYSWLALHLDETAPLLVQNALTDFQVMRSKMLALVLASAAFLAFIAAGTVAIRLSEARSRWCTRQVPGRNLLAATAGLVGLMVLQQALSPHVLGAKAYEAERRTLWQASFWPRPAALPARTLFSIESPEFRQVPGEAAVRTTLATVSPERSTPPLNVFLFIVDSLRDDAVSQDVAPNLLELKRRALPVSAGVAASNVTHISWFSILHAVNPIFWSVEAHQAHSAGAVPLRALSQAGYRIRALACPSLLYFGFARSVFGDDNRLADWAVGQEDWLRSNPDAEEGELDERVMERLNTELDGLDPESRAFYLVLLNAPHHDYTWPRDYEPEFTPFMPKVPLLATSITSENVEQLRNRYKNAVHSTDRLLGQFLRRLSSRGLMDSSVIVVTGDHGEEFLETGHLAHSSNLDRFQTRVPIVIAIPPSITGPVPPAAGLASHVDIMPTVLDAVGLGQVVRVLGGRSLLSDAGEPQAAFCAMASSYSPSHVLVDSGNEKLLIDFEGIGKLGRTLYARRLLATGLLDRDFREVPADRDGAGTLRARWRSALQTILANP